MKTYTPQDIALIKASLPEDLKQALASVDMMQELRMIVAEQHLHIDEAGAVADVVELTLSGILRVREFIQTLRGLLPEAGNDKVIAIAEAINKRIFAKVRTSLQKIDQDENLSLQEGVEVPELPALPIVPTPPTVKVIPPSPSEVTAMEIPAPPPAPIHEQKMAAPVNVQPATTDISHVNMDPRVKLVPNDVRQRINSDPYKEPIN